MSGILWPSPIILALRPCHTACSPDDTVDGSDDTIVICGGMLSRRAGSYFSCQLAAWCPFVSFTTTVAVPATTTAPPATIAIFAFVHAITFNAPFTRTEMDPLAARPFAAAMAVTDFANAAG